MSFFFLCRRAKLLLICNETLFNIAYMDQMIWMNCQWVVWSGDVAKLPRHEGICLFTCVLRSPPVFKPFHTFARKSGWDMSPLKTTKYRKRIFIRTKRGIYIFHKRVLFVIMQLYDGEKDNLFCLFSLIGFKKTFHWNTSFLSNFIPRRLIEYRSWREWSCGSIKVAVCRCISFLGMMIFALWTIFALSSSHVVLAFRLPRPFWV